LNKRTLPPFASKKKWAGNDCRPTDFMPHFVNITMMQGNRPPLVIPIRPSLAAVLDGQGKSHLTFVPRLGSPNGTAFSGPASGQIGGDPQRRQSWCDGLCLGGNTTDSLDAVFYEELGCSH
jgi:hypothetical protein